MKKKNVVLRVLLILLILEICFIPILVLAEVKRVLPIIAFIILPTIGAIVVYLLGKNCINTYEKKKKKIEERLSNN